MSCVNKEGDTVASFEQSGEVLSKREIEMSEMTSFQFTVNGGEVTNEKDGDLNGGFLFSN